MNTRSVAVSFLKKTAQDPWGFCTSINIYGIDAKAFGKEEIKKFIDELCRIIDMEKYGEPEIHHFGKGDKFGYSFAQFIMTSLISGHIVEEDNKAYVDIFSCKEYDSRGAAEFTRNFFKAKAMNFMQFHRP